MNDDYKQGLITGLAMQPLCVVQGSNDNKADFSEHLDSITACIMKCGIADIGEGKFGAELNAE